MLKTFYAKLVEKSAEAVVLGALLALAGLWKFWPVLLQPLTRRLAADTQVRMMATAILLFLVSDVIFLLWVWREKTRLVLRKDGYKYDRQGNVYCGHCDKPVQVLTEPVGGFQYYRCPTCD